MLSVLLRDCGVDEFSINGFLTGNFQFQIIPEIGANGYQLMNMLETDWGRAVNVDLWFKTLQTLYPHNRLAVERVRFQNESNWITTNLNGIIIEVVKPGAEPPEGTSPQYENQDLLEHHYSILNQGTVADLHESMLSIMHDLNNYVVGD
jgi:hypothetical protein